MPDALVTTPVATALLVVFAVVAVVLYWLIVMAPVQVAKGRRHSNVDGVKALCWISLVLPVLWIVAICWAYMGESK